MPSSLNPPTEFRETRRSDLSTNGLVIERVFQVFGQTDQVRARWLANTLVPRMNDRYPATGFSDPQETDLRVTSVSIEVNPREPTVGEAIVTYSTNHSDTSLNPEVTLSVGTEAFTKKWDDKGRPILPRSRDGIVVEIPTVELSYTLTLQNFGVIASNFLTDVGKTNSAPWAGMAKWQWVFLGAGAGIKLGVNQWRATFNFRGYPSFPAGYVAGAAGQGGGGAGPGGQEMAEERGRFYYYFPPKPDGSTESFQKTVIREEADFNTIFSFANVG